MVYKAAKLVRYLQFFNTNCSTRLSSATFGTASNMQQADIKEAVAVVYRQYGDPRQVLELDKIPVKVVGNNDALIKAIAIAIHPADINIIQGVYPAKLPLPAVGGVEGVFKIVKTGSNVSSLKPGDLVMPKGLTTMGGAWRSYGVCPEKELRLVPSGIAPELAAVMANNYCTAYRMLKTFEQLKPGDYIIQTGANSATGQAVIQVANTLGIKSINIVRNRPNLDQLKAHLMELGATYVFADDADNEMKTTLSKIPKAKLGMDCVAGRGGMKLFRYLAPNSTLILYGGMSLQPLSVPVGAAIFQNIKVCGVWTGKWIEKNEDTAENKEMFDFLFNLARTGKLKPVKHRLVPVTDFKEAINRTMESFSGEKQLLVFDGSDSLKASL